MDHSEGAHARQSQWMPNDQCFRTDNQISGFERCFVGGYSKPWLLIEFLFKVTPAGVDFCETSELIVAGVMRYWKVFYLSDLLGFLSTSLFLSGVLCMIHDSLPFTVCVVIDIVGGVAGVCVVVAHYLVIIAKQEYADGSPTPPTRKIFKHGKKALV